LLRDESRHSRRVRRTRIHLRLSAADFFVYRPLQQLVVPRWPPPPV